MLTRSASVILSPSEDGYVAYDTRHDRLYRLNPTAALIVELCDGTRDRAQLRHDLQPAVGSNWAHCNDWLDTAIDDQLLLAAAPTEAAVPVATGTAHDDRNWRATRTTCSVGIGCWPPFSANSAPTSSPRTTP